MTQIRSHKHFFEHIEQAKYRCIFALSGSLPDPSFFHSLPLPVIAVDGAANVLVAQGINPYLILGDFDSVQPELLQKYRSLHLPDQSHSDFEKAHAQLKQLDLLPAIIVGINGGYIDHVINNINLFMNTDCIFYDAPIVGHILKEKSVSRFTLPCHSKLSLLGIPTTNVSTSGLKWNLDHEDLTFPGRNSCFNRTSDSQIILEVHKGTVLACIYLEPVIDAGW